MLARARSAVLAIPLVLATIAAPVAVAAEPAPASATSQAGRPAPSHYVRVVRQDRPTALLQRTRDLMGGRRGAVVGAPEAARLPNGDPALDFNGRGQFARFADRSAFEVSRRGVLTVEYWMRPDALQFSDEEGSGYVYVLGKGDPGRHEYYGRMYSRSNSESRPNRISGYSFNPQGGLGAGSYFQDPVKAGRWIHVALVINAKHRSSRYPTGYTKIFKNGVLRDTDSLAGYDIKPRPGSAPFRIGTGYLDSFFDGAVGNVAFYHRALGAKRLGAHYRAMVR